MQQGRLSTVQLMTMGRADIGHETRTIAGQLKKKKSSIVTYSCRETQSINGILISETTTYTISVSVPL